MLDSFAGSGSTGHAILKLNHMSNGKRRFILIEIDETTACEKTARRLNACISGYTEMVKPFRKIEGLGGGFRFCRLGVPLFDEFGDIAAEVTFPDLAAHIFFSETGVPIPSRAQSEFLGVHQGRAVYLLFDAAHAQTPREAAGNVLTPDRLASLPAPPDGFEGDPRGLRRRLHRLRRPAESGGRGIQTNSLSGRGVLTWRRSNSICAVISASRCANFERYLRKVS